MDTPLDGKSLDITADKLEQLKAIIPEAFSEGRLDWERLRQTLGEAAASGDERYVLNWAGKGDALRAIQTPTTATLTPDRAESVNFDSSENIFIEGENLETLKVLQKSYYGKIKMIYIDPPYNTGNDSFVYPDKFSESREEYLKRIGDKSEDGQLLRSGVFQKNSKDSGHYHSNWLSMMYPRLFLARNLLREDGVIFVSIDDNEVHNLRLLMNEIFGEECFKNLIVVRRGVKNVQAQFETIDSLTVGHEYIVMYSKTSETRFPQFTIDLDELRPGSWNNHWRGTDRPTMRYELLGITPASGQWRWSKERSLTAIENYKQMAYELGYSELADIPQEEIDSWYEEKLEDVGEIDLLRLSKNNRPEHYIPPTSIKMGSDLWTDLSPRDNEFAKLLDRSKFNNPKPLAWLERAIAFTTKRENHDIVLDFFAGSASTAHAVYSQNKKDRGNRKYILVQLPEKTTDSDYATIADIARERIRRALKSLMPPPPPPPRYTKCSAWL